MPDLRDTFEIVVIGAGPAGLAAAGVAAECGRRVALIEATPWLGGQIWRGQERPIPIGPVYEAIHQLAVVQPDREIASSLQPHPPEAEGEKIAARRRFWRSKREGRGNYLPSSARRWLSRFHASGATLLHSTQVVAAPRSGVLLAEHQDGPREIGWQRLVVATGARELFLPFPGWTLPGVMGPGGLQGLAKQGWPVENQKIVVAGSGPLLLAAADGLARHGARVVTIVEQAPWHRVARFGLRLGNYPAKLGQALAIRCRLAAVPYRCGAWPVRAEGKEMVRSVLLTDGRQTWAEDCDLLACGFGLLPNIELPELLGCEVANGMVKVDQWQATSVKDVYCAGESTGIGGADCALTEGLIAGYAAAGNTKQAKLLFAKRDSWHRFRTALALTFALRPELKALATDATIVCRCEDVTFGQLRQFTSWREAKLLSRCGMGSCQGRVCGGATRELFGWGAESVRPPVLPARVGSLISRVSPGGQA